MLQLRVKDSDKAKRVDVFIAKKLPEFTRSSLSRLFDKNLVLANGQTVKASYRLREGDKVDVDISLLTTRPANIELPIMYEDEDVIVLNKPAGVLTHSKGALNTEATVASFIASKLTDKNLVGNRAGIVHRLDRATSGVIITARNGKTLNWLQKQFSTRKVKKTYLAITEGSVNPSEAIIDAPIKRNPKKPQTFKVGAEGKPAQTKYKVIETFKKSGRDYSLLELNPQTGRTHQLRVHLKYIGHPVVGDRVYGHAGGNLYLHASSLELTLSSGRKMKFEVPETKIFKEFTKQ